MNIRQSLAIRRKQTRHSLESIEKKTGIGKSQLSRILNEKIDAQASTLEAIAAALDAEILVVPKELVYEVRQFIGSRGQVTSPVSKSAAETFLEQAP